jgi:hypothetical protein
MRKRWSEALAAATGVAVVLLSALFAWIHNQ